MAKKLKLEQTSTHISRPEDEDNDEKKEFDAENDEVSVPLWTRFGADSFTRLPFGGLAPHVPHTVCTGKRSRS